MPKIEYVKLKLGRIYQTPSGNIAFGRAPIQPGPKPGTPDEDAWWFDVLWDPRARYPQRRDIPAEHPDARFRVDQLRQASVIVRCRCGRSATVSKEDLHAKFGSDANVIVIAREIFECRERSREGNLCKAVIVR